MVKGGVGSNGRDGANGSNGVDKIRVLEGLFDKKRIEILRVFLAEPEKQFYLREVAKFARVPPATTYRILDLLIKLEVLEIKTVSRFKVYQLNKSENTKFLDAFLKEQPLILDMFVDQVKTMGGVERIVLHGKPETDKANILIVGRGVDQGEIKRISADIWERHKFKLSSLTLESEQYEQMTRMGLYPGQKKTLFKK